VAATSDTQKERRDENQLLFKREHGKSQNPEFWCNFFHNCSKMTEPMANQFDRNRAAAIGNVLKHLPVNVWEEIDRQQPEWPVLEALCKMTEPGNVLAGIALGLSDYQANGRSNNFWEQASTLLAQTGSISTTQEARLLLRAILSRGGVRLAKIKLARVDRLCNSTLPGWLADFTIQELGSRATPLWEKLAEVMNQRCDAKTIVMGMKMVDQMYKIVTEKYLDFNPRIPIGVDSRIAKISLSSGLVSPPNGMTVVQAIKGQRLDEFTKAKKKDIIGAWDGVLSNTNTISILRIDSLAWQLGEIVNAKGIAVKLALYGTDAAMAESIAYELTAALDGKSEQS
jgi:N-glycosylase/DNA lyase